jgi:Kef-type K+ transport system membrane component KefB
MARRFRDRRRLRDVVDGMHIAETPYRHQVEGDIRPFRDVVLGLFFVTVGMMLDLAFVVAQLPWVLLAPLLFLGAKGASEVIPEVIEGSLMRAVETLSQLGVPVERAIEQIRSTRVQVGDVLVLIGAPAQLAFAEDLLQRGRA